MSKVYPSTNPEKLASYIGSAIYRQWPLNNGCRHYANIAKEIGLQGQDIIKSIGYDVEGYLRKYLLSNSPNITQYDKNFALELFVSCLHHLTVQKISQDLLRFQCDDNGKLAVAIIKCQFHDHSAENSEDGNYDSAEDPHKELAEEDFLIGLGSLSFSKMNSAAAAAEWD